MCLLRGDGMVKDSTRSQLLLLRDQYGTDVAIKVARSALRVRSDDGEFKKQFNGEVCEVVLEMFLQEMIKGGHPDWFYVKGMILPDAESYNREFLTEIDFVVFTRACVYCIECKSYAGDKSITGNGTINLKSSSRDVYKQNSMHLEVLDKMISRFSIAEKPVYQMLMFNFSHGECRDLREERAKCIFPVVDERSFASAITVSDEDNWDLVGLLRAKPKFEKFSKVTRAKHLEYVKQLHREENHGS